MLLQLLRIAAVAALIAMVGCGSDDASGGGSGSPDEKVNLAAFLAASENTYAQANLKGIEKAAEKLGDVEVTAFDGKFDGVHQASQVRDATASGRFDAYVIFSNDGAAVAPAVRQAAKDDIKVVAAYAPIGPSIFTAKPQEEDVVGTVWHNDPRRGEGLGQLAISACKEEHADADPCRVGYLSGGNDIAYEKAKLDSFTETIAGGEQAIEIVSQQEGGFLPGPSRTATQNMLQANRDIDVIVTTGDQMTLGAEQAVESAGLTGDISLIGVGATEQGLEAVRDERWYATQVSMPRTEGELAAKMAVEAVRGKTPKRTSIEVPALSPIGPAFTRDTKDPFSAQWSI